MDEREAEAEYVGWFDMISASDNTVSGVGDDDGTAASRAGSDADPPSLEDSSSDHACNDLPGCSTGARVGSINANRSSGAMPPSISEHLVAESEGAALPPAHTVDSRAVGGLGGLIAPRACSQASTASHIHTSFGSLTSEASPFLSPDAATRLQPGSGNDTLGNRRSDEGTRCWGGMLAGDSSSCEPLQPTNQKCIHFKERICTRCTASGILVPRARIRVLEAQHNSVFTNRPTQGLWTQTHMSLPGFRVVNQTQGCPGPPLVIFETAPEAEALGRFCLRHVESGDVVHLQLCRGTFVPRSSTKRMRSGIRPVARALPPMGSPPKKMQTPRAADQFGARHDARLGGADQFGASGAMQGAGFQGAGAGAMQGAGFQGAGYQGAGALGGLSERSGLEIVCHPALLPSMCTLQTLGTTLATGQQTLGTTLATGQQTLGTTLATGQQTLGTTLATGQQTLCTTLAAAGQPWLGSARHSAPVSDAVELRGRIGDLPQPGVPTSKTLENGPALEPSGQAGAASPGAPHAQLLQPLFVQVRCLPLMTCLACKCSPQRLSSCSAM